MQSPPVKVTTATGWDHVPGLDGVRGVAVIAVLLFHGGVSWARGGFLGVDAFFVLSGLLITSLLLDEADRTGTIGLGHFWARRARRLLPALLVVVAAAGAYGALRAPPGALAGLRRDALATLLYVANWRFIEAGANYFESTAAPSVLRHTWSLAIEEQFYLAWPLVLFVIARSRTRLRWTAFIAGAGALASAVAMAMLFEPGADPSRAYYGTDTRAQAVLIGSALAAAIAWLRRRESFANAGAGAAGAALSVAGGVGAVMFVIAVLLIDGDETALFRGGFFALSAGVGAFLACIVLVPYGALARLVSAGPLRAVGLISYGLYLWHWPVYLTMTSEATGLAGALLLAARLAVTTVIAMLSYYFIEMPIRRGKLPGIQGLVGAVAALGVATAAVLVGTEPHPISLSPSARAERTPSGYPVSLRPARADGEPARVLVLGDSIAQTLAMRLQRPARGEGIELINKGVLGCGIVRGGPFRYFGQQRDNPHNCEDWPRQWADHVGRFDPDVILVIVGRWEVMDRVHDGRWTQLGDPSFDSYIESELEQAANILTVGDATVAFTTAPYFLRGERPDGGRWPEDDPVRVDQFNTILRRVAERHSDRAAILDLNGRTSVGGQYTPVIDGVSLRYDGVHFSPQGATWLSPWLFGALLEMAPPSGGSVRRVPVVEDPQITPTSGQPRGQPSTTTAPPEPDATTTTEPEPTTTSTAPGPPSTTTPTVTLPVPPG